MTDLAKPQPQRVEVRRVEPTLQEQAAAVAMNKSVHDAIYGVTVELKTQILIAQRVYPSRPWCGVVVTTS
jgi:hypothetical protein